MILAEGEIVRQAALPDRGVLASLSLLRVLRGFCVYLANFNHGDTATKQDKINENQPLILPYLLGWGRARLYPCSEPF